MESIATRFDQQQQQFELLVSGLSDTPEHLLWQGGTAWQPTGGRRPVRIIETTLGEGVLKHYHRGGWLARCLQDRYLFTGLEATRSFAEFRLLHALSQKNLPIPTPIAARVCVYGWYYRADLLTQRIENSISLHDALVAGQGSAALARRVGETIARFHRVGVHHADLNAHNILVTAQQIHLIDFDLSRILAPNLRWQIANLARLKRSLRKLGHLGDACSEAVFWRPLQDAHRAGLMTPWTPP